MTALIEHPQVHALATRHRIEWNARLTPLCSAFVVAMAVMSGIGYTGMAADLAAGTPKANSWSPELRAYLTQLDPATFVAIAATDTLYKAFFSFALMLVGLLTWRIVGVSYAEGVHKYMLLGGRSRLDVAFHTLGVLVAAIIELVAMALLATAVVGVIAFGGRLGHVTAAEAGSAIALYSAALVPLINYALVVAIAGRLHMPRIGLLIAATTAPIVLGLIDTLTVSKFVSPWGVLSFFLSVPSLDATFVAALALELVWSGALVAAFLFLSAREQPAR